MLNKKFLYSMLFLFVIVSGAQASYLLDRVVAVVNQEVITWSELYRYMEADATPAMKALPDTKKRQIFKENEALFLEGLIAFRLQVQEAVNSRLAVSEEEVRETIEGIKKKYSMTDDQFQDSLSTEGYSMKDYKKQLADQILQTKVVNMQVRNKIVVTDQDVDAFIRDNKDFISNTETYRIRQVFFPKPKDRAETGRVEEKAESVYAMARQGTDFAELAREFSEDATRVTGGDLGVIERGNLATEFLAALAPLKEGDVSKPFWSERGMHILKLEERSRPRTAAEVKEEAKSALQNKLFNERYKGWIRSLREKSYIDIRL